MGHEEYQGGGSSFLLKFILFIVMFIALVSYVISRNSDVLIVQ